MSATLLPFGLRPVYHPSGVARARGYPQGTASGYATNLYQFTPVQMNTSGNIVVAANAADMIGVFDGVEYTDANGRRQYVKQWTASTAPTGTDWIVYVYDDPAIIYEIQAEGSLLQTAIGDQVNFSSTSGRAVGDGNSTPGQSSAAVSTSLAGAGVQGMLRVLDKARYVDNDWGDSFTIIQVQIARHQYASNKVAF